MNATLSSCFLPGSTLEKFLGKLKALCPACCGFRSRTTFGELDDRFEETMTFTCLRALPCPVMPVWLLQLERPQLERKYAPAPVCGLEVKIAFLEEFMLLCPLVVISGQERR